MHEFFFKMEKSKADDRELLHRDATSLLYEIITGAIEAREVELAGVYRGISRARRRFQEVWGLQQGFLRTGYDKVLSDDPIYSRIPEIIHLHPRDILSYVLEKLDDAYLIEHIKDSFLSHQ